MNTYTVTMPFVGQATFTVEAESEKEVREKIWGLLPKMDCRPSDPESHVDVEWDFMEHVVRGNILSFSTANSMTVEDDDDPDA